MPRPPSDAATGLKRAMPQLSEAESPAEILPEEGQGRERVVWEAAWADRQRAMDIWEARCRAALRQVYWERVKAMGRWAVDMLQWRLNKIILRQHQWNWDRGWLQFRAQEEAAKLWVREGVQAVIIIFWHVRVLEHNARRAVHAQVQPRGPKS